MSKACSWELSETRPNHRSLEASLWHSQAETKKLSHQLRAVFTRSTSSERDGLSLGFEGIESHSKFAVGLGYERKGKVNIRLGISCR